RTGAQEASDTLTYTTNNLNQYSQWNLTGGVTNSLTYDHDGNLTCITSGATTVQYTYNAENRLIAVEPETPSSGDTKVEFLYDYMGRRVEKLVYAYGSGEWQLEKEVLFENGVKSLINLRG
ncbi:MAG: hypothetical protein SV375_24055, partial [Thermodesulfobacteriota bacterium]|nr:hypothetical protein [Thermodesulfobacteriota bacterium]